MTVQDIDVAIIGAGTAGLTARAEVARQTDSYRVFDPGPLGTTCARVGCMPSKAFLHAAHAFHRRHDFDSLGIRGAGTLSVDGAAVLSETRKLRDRFVEGVVSGMQPWRETHFVADAARFDADGLLHAGGQSFRPRRTVIATGTGPVVPSEWAEALGPRVVTTDRFFDLPDLPRRMAVIGLGPLGLELGQALARLGVEVTAFDPSRAIGGLSDPDMQDRAIAAVSREMRLVFGEARLVPSGDSAVRAEWEDGSVEVDCVLAAMGRRPNIADLGLEHLGLRPGEGGRLPLDPETLRVPGSEVFVAGDVTGLRPLLHEAADEGRIAGYNAAAGKDVAFRRRVALQIVFCEPQIALVGKSWADLEGRAEAGEIATGTAQFDSEGRALLARAAEGAIRVYAEKSTARLLGAALFTSEAEHMAHLLARACEDRNTLKDVLRMPFYHPTLEEGLRGALRRALSECTVETEPLEEIRCQDAPVESDPTEPC